MDSGTGAGRAGRGARWTLRRWARRCLRARAARAPVRAAAEAVYSELGWGWREDVYREALAVELRRRGRAVQKEVVFPIRYKGEVLSHVGLRVDMVVGGTLVVELKANAGEPAALRRAEQQCRRYVRILAAPSLSGLVLNFPDKSGRTVQARAVAWS